MAKITHAELIEVFYYDPVTSIFTCLYTLNREQLFRLRNKEWVIQLCEGYYPVPVLAWLYIKGAWPQGIIRRKNWNYLDYSWKNLQIMYPKNIPGVTFYKRTNKWQVHIKGQHIGVYNIRVDAIHARLEAGKNEGMEYRGQYVATPPEGLIEAMEGKSWYHWFGVPDYASQLTGVWCYPDEIRD